MNPVNEYAPGVRVLNGDASPLQPMGCMLCDRESIPHIPQGMRPTVRGFWYGPDYSVYCPGSRAVVNLYNVLGAGAESHRHIGPVSAAVLGGAA